MLDTGKKIIVVGAFGLVKIGRDAVGERPKPKSGLRAYFDPLRTSLKAITSLSSEKRY